jgi:hypothetical protein
VRALAGSLAAILLPSLAAARALRATVVPLRAAGATPALLAHALAIPLGLGAASLLGFAWLALVGRPGTGYAALEAATFASLALMARSPAGGSERRPWTRGELWLLAVIAVAAVAAVAAFLALSFRLPDGDWDAWAMWNTRARLFARAEGPGEGLGLVVAHANFDYPLLLPITVARSWAYAGAETKAAPALVALAFTAAAAAIPALAAALMRGRLAGLLAAGVLLATPELVSHGRAQYADLPLGLFLAAGLALALLASWGSATRGASRGSAPRGASRERDAAAAAWCAFALACGAWTKNEGILLACAFAVVFAARAALRRRLSAATLAAVFLGALAPALALLVFKLRWAPPSYLTANQSAEGIAARVLDPARAGQVAVQLAQTFARFGHGAVALLAGVWVLARGGRPGPSWPFAVLALVLSGYALVYLATPLDLSWQLRTSAERLVLQLWPAAVLATALRLSPAPPPVG